MLLVTGTIALFVALCLPWWSLRMQVFQERWVTVSPAFSGWGWLSFAAWLVALTMTRRLVVIGWPHGNRSHNRGAAWVIVIAGAAELLGNVMFIVSAPKTEVFGSAGQFASYGAGLILAIVAGVMLVASGLLMLGSKDRAPVSAVPVTAARAGPVLLAAATMLLAIALFVPWSSGLLFPSLGGGPWPWSLDVWSGLSGTLSRSYSLGWLLDFALWLTVAVTVVALALTATAWVGKRLYNATVARVSVAAGVAELIAAALFVIAVPKSFNKGLGGTRLSHISGGLPIAVVAGVLLIASGLLMLGTRIRPEPAGVASAGHGPEVSRSPQLTTCSRLISPNST